MFIEYKNEFDKKYNEKLNNTGVFWAFSNEQFEENKTHKDAPDDEYIAVGMGGYIHKSNKDKFNNFFEVELPKLRNEFISKINMEDMIEYELKNHECFYTGNYLEIADIISSFYNLPFVEICEKIKNVYYEKMKSMSDINDMHIDI